MTLTIFSTSQEAQQAAALMDGYRFELGSHDAPQWVSLWLASYSPEWIKFAVIEALYQGRYKAYSVRQILELWQKRQKPIRHTSHEFEAAVCREYAGIKSSSPASSPTAAAKPVAFSKRRNQESATLRASRRTHQSLSSISFNLSETTPYTHRVSSDRPAASSQPIADDTAIPGSQIGHDTSTAHAATRTARQELIETAETLQSQRQVNGVSYSSARAIQPFKPALPFSAQSLRLAKQKALAIR